MLPRSTDVSTGAIKTTDWMKMAWKYKTTPSFNPLEVRFVKNISVSLPVILCYCHPKFKMQLMIFISSYFVPSVEILNLKLYFFQ